MDRNSIYFDEKPTILLFDIYNMTNLTKSMMPFHFLIYREKCHSSDISYIHC